MKSALNQASFLFAGFQLLGLRDKSRRDKARFLCLFRGGKPPFWDHCKRLKFGSVVADSNINEFVAGLCHQLLYDHRYEPSGYFRKKEVTRDQRLTLNSGFGSGSIWIPVRPPKKNTHFALVNGSFKLFRYCIWFSQEALIMPECRIHSLNQHSTASFQVPICLSPAVLKVYHIYPKKSRNVFHTGSSKSFQNASAPNHLGMSENGVYPQ